MTEIGCYDALYLEIINYSVVHANLKAETNIWRGTSSHQILEEGTDLTITHQGRYFSLVFLHSNYILTLYLLIHGA